MLTSAGWRLLCSDVNSETAALHDALLAQPAVEIEVNKPSLSV